MKYDFSGYATKNDLRCTDGRTIRRGAFSECDGIRVPLVWQHMHDSVENVLGHADLEERSDGMYAYGVFNDTPAGQHAKNLVKHGDIRSLSIYANHLRQQGGDVVHGMIREVSLVLSGANPGAAIDNVSFAHSDGTWEEIDDEAIITLGENYFYHADEEDEEPEEEPEAGSDGETVQEIFDTLSEKQKQAVYAIIGAALEDQGDEKPVAHADEEDEEDEEPEEEPEAGSDGETVQEIFDTLSEKQKQAVYAIIGAALENQNDSDDVQHYDFEGDNMKFNVFDEETNDTHVLSHADMTAIFDDAPRIGSLREAALAHGIEDIEVFFPEAQAVNNQPYQIVRRMEWVSVVLNGVHKSPFARIKSTAANLTEDQARAKGYVKGRKKIEEQISALRRITTPQTVYKVQKLDRDDIIDITDFDVVAWMKQEMRMMLDEEVARAILIGDGRLSADPEKIFPDHIRPVWSDEEMYTIHVVIPAASATDYSAMIDEVIRGRKGYKGSGNPVMFIGPDALTEMRLLKDNDQRFRYKTDQELAEALRVSAIHEVEVFDDVVRTVEGKDRKLIALVLNLGDYTVGANKGGEVSLFDDFDLDYNKYEYLIETRMSGALTVPKSAIAIEVQTTTDSVADPTYTRVASPVTADIADYYEQDEYGRYVQTTDTSVVTGKKYFELDE